MDRAAAADGNPGVGRRADVQRVEEQGDGEREVTSITPQPFSFRIAGALPAIRDLRRCRWKCRRDRAAAHRRRGPADRPDAIMGCDRQLVGAGCRQYSASRHDNGWRRSAHLCREIGSGGMDTEDLRAFVEVADSGGISSAARRMGVSKSIISRALNRLEQELGVQLLARTTRGASLTEAGRIFRRHARKACAEIEAAQEVIQCRDELRGQLRISAPLTFGPTHIAPILARMARQHPDLHIHATYSDRVIDIVSEGYDCAVRSGFLKDSTLVARRVGPIHSSLVASPDYIRTHGSPETVDEFLRHAALMQGTEAWLLTDGEVIAVHPRGIFKADNGVALAAAALAGVGIAWLPDKIIETHLASGALVRVMTKFPPPVAGMYVVRPPGPRPSRKLQLLTDLLIECFET
jgi:DNA-binding transcriptional LysR family regulator